MVPQGNVRPCSNSLRLLPEVQPHGPSTVVQREIQSSATPPIALDITAVSTPCAATDGKVRVSCDGTTRETWVSCRVSSDSSALPKKSESPTRPSVVDCFCCNSTRATRRRRDGLGDSGRGTGHTLRWPQGRRPLQWPYVSPTSSRSNFVCCGKRRCDPRLASVRLPLLDSVANS